LREARAIWPCSIYAVVKELFNFKKNDHYPSIQPPNLERAPLQLSAVLGSSPLRKTLRAHGYVPSPLKTGCRLSPALLIVQELEALLKGRSHHLMMGDFDRA
jgi:hypothetical protein